MLHAEASLAGLENILSGDTNTHNRLLSKLGRKFDAQSEEQKELFGYETIPLLPELYEDARQIDVLASNLADSGKFNEHGLNLVAIIQEESKKLINNFEMYQKYQDAGCELESYFSGTPYKETRGTDSLWKFLRRRRLRKKIEMLPKEEKEDFFKNHVYSSIVHQVRNPVTVIGGLAQRLLNYVDADSPEYEKLVDILDRTYDIESLVVEQYSINNQLCEDTRYCNLNKIIGDVAEHVYQRKGGRYIRVDPENPLPSIMSASHALKTSFRLLFHEIKKGDGKAPLLVTLGEETDSEVQLRMFNEFFSPDSAQPGTTTLTRAANYIARLGGRLETSPHLDGTAVCLYLPKELDLYSQIRP